MTELQAELKHLRKEFGFVIAVGCFFGWLLTPSDWPMLWRKFDPQRPKSCTTTFK